MVLNRGDGLNGAIEARKIKRILIVVEGDLDKGIGVKRSWPTLK